MLRGLSVAVELVTKITCVAWLLVFVGSAAKLIDKIQSCPKRFQEIFIRCVGKPFPTHLINCMQITVLFIDDLLLVTYQLICVFLVCLVISRCLVAVTFHISDVIILCRTVTW